MKSVGALVVGMTVFLLPEAVRAYRTNADRTDLSVSFEEPPRWSERTSIRFALRSDVRYPFDAYETERAVDRGFAAWRATGCASPTPEFVGYATDEDTLPAFIQWVSQSSAELPPDVLATTDIEFQEAADGWRIVSATIVLSDTRTSPSLRPSAGVARLDVVVAHETGHALGLAHPCRVDEEHADRGAAPCTEEHGSLLMHPTYDAAIDPALGEDDRRGLCAIYGTETTTTVDGVDECEGSRCKLRGWDIGHFCESADVCNLNVCIVDDGSGYCSSRCEASEHLCGDGFSCRQVGDVGQFCLLDEASGCSASGSRGLLNVGWIFLVLIVGARSSLARRMVKSS